MGIAESRDALQQSRVHQDVEDAKLAAELMFAGRVERTPSVLREWRHHSAVFALQHIGSLVNQTIEQVSIKPRQAVEMVDKVTYRQSHTHLASLPSLASLASRFPFFSLVGFSFRSSMSAPGR